MHVPILIFEIIYLWFFSKEVKNFQFAETPHQGSLLLRK